jgi:hypothetical protein
VLYEFTSPRWAAEINPASSIQFQPIQGLAMPIGDLARL